MRFTLDISFESEVEKTAFSQTLSIVRDLLTPRGAAKLDNREFLLALFDCARSQPRTCHSARSPAEELSAPSTGSFMREAGKL